MNKMQLKQLISNFFYSISLKFKQALYYQQDMYDNAIANYQKALDYYKKTPDSEIQQLPILNLLGRAFDAEQNLDSAYIYFNDGLSIAKKKNNRRFEATFLHQLGAFTSKKEV